MQSLAQKLRLRAGDTILPIGLPEDIRSLLLSLKEKPAFSEKPDSIQQVHMAVRSQADMKRLVPQFLKILRKSRQGWVYFPKGSSALKKDLTRDHGWELLRERSDLQQLNLISIDENWSAFSFRFVDQPIAKAEKTDFSPWINTAAKTTQLPPDVIKAFRGKKDLLQTFEAMAYTHRREYLEWILTAKKDETRNKRISGLLEKMAAKQK